MELTILDFLQANLRSPFGDVFFTIITTLGNGGILWVVLAVLLAIIPKTRRIGITMAIAIAIEALCCNLILKPLVARVRPYDINQTVQLLIKRPKDYSFPSGHTGVAFAATGALLFSKSKLWIPTIVLSSLIAFSRMYLYVHYPTDVLAGLVLGMAAGWLASMIMKLWIRKRSNTPSSSCNALGSNKK